MNRRAFMQSLSGALAGLALFRFVGAQGVIEAPSILLIDTPSTITLSRISAQGWADIMTTSAGGTREYIRAAMNLGMEQLLCEPEEIQISYL